MIWWRKKTGSLFLLNYSRKKYISDIFLLGILRNIKARLIFNKTKIFKEKLVSFPKEFLKLCVKIIFLKKKKKLNIDHRNELLLNNLKNFQYVRNYYFKKITEAREKKKKYSLISFFSYSNVYKNVNNFNKKLLWINLIYIVINESFSKKSANKGTR